VGLAKQNGVIGNEVIMIAGDKVRFGSWDPNELEHGESLNVLESKTKDTYSFHLHDALLGGREALWKVGTQPFEINIFLSLNLPYLYVYRKSYSLITKQLETIAPSIDCNEAENYCRFNM